MLEKLVAFSWALSGATDADAVALIMLPTQFGFTVLGVGFAGSSGGTVTTCDWDVQDDGVDITGCTALDTTTVAGEYSAADRAYDTHIGAGSVIDLDLNITGGGNITGIVTLYGYFDEA